MKLKSLLILISLLLLPIVNAQSDDLSELQGISFNNTQFDAADQDALEEAWNVLKDNYSNYDLWELYKETPNTFQKNCMDSAFALASDIADACQMQGSDLENWKIDTITTKESCHDAVMLTSPGTNPRYYFFDGYLNDHKIVELQRNGDEYTSKNSFDELPDFVGCIGVSKVNRKTYKISTRDEITLTGVPGFFRGFKNPIPTSVHVECVSNPGSGPTLSEVVDIPDACFDIQVDEEQAQGVITVTSLDPNDKVGPAGVGTARYIQRDIPLNYVVYFENIETATAAAQEVIITDQLDVSNLDLSTFELGAVGFGEELVTPPGGLQEYITEVDLRPGNNLIVRIDMSLNLSSGLITWIFTSLDPDTRAFTEDPTAGFLPPNVAPPEGDGFVSYVINAKDTLVTGDDIDNNASIVFDTNSPIVTPTWTNTIDITKPQSSVASLSDPQISESFDISWTGSDSHSGINEYSLYVSENSGPFIKTLVTTGTMTSFIGVNGYTYGFYTIAEDKVGNIEDAPGQADVTVTIDDPMQEPCTVYDDYLVGVSCFLSETVTNDAELDDYLFDYGYNGSKYKDLVIDYNVNRTDIDIHSPCEIKIKTSHSLTGQRVCIDGREGISAESYLTVNGTFVTLISDLGDVRTGINSAIVAKELTLNAYKTAELSVTGSITVDDALVIKSTGNTISSKATMGQSSAIHAGSVRLEAIREVSTGPSLTLTVDDNLELISTGTEFTSKSMIGISSTISASTLEMSADKNVEIGASTNVSIVGAASLTSGGSNISSDVILGLDASISADSLDMTAGDESRVNPFAEVAVTNNFNMDADTPGDCYIDSTATISAGTESGNCL